MTKLRVGDIFIYKECDEVWVQGVIFNVDKREGLNNFNEHNGYRLYSYFIIANGSCWYIIDKNNTDIGMFNQYSHFDENLTVVDHMDEADLLAKVL